MATKKSDNDIMKKQALPRYIIAFLIIVLGTVLDYLGYTEEFLGFQSVGTWLVFVGFIMLAIITINLISKKKKIIDERMQWLAYKASRITFIVIIFAAFIIMVWDGIRTMYIPYSMFMSYMIAFIVLIYFIAYKILEKRE